MFLASKICNRFMRFLSVFLVAFVTQAHSQTIAGKLINCDGVGVEFAHIYFPEVLKGTISDSLGNFILAGGMPFKHIQISCLGYYDTIVSVSGISNKPICLRSKEYEIDEVSKVARRSVELLVGCKQKRPNDITFTNTQDKKSIGWITYFPRNSSASIKSFAVFLNEVSSPNCKLHVRILSPDTTHQTLGFDIMKSERWIDSLKKGWNEVDLSNQMLRFSKHGVIVHFYITGIEPTDRLVIGGTSNNVDYGWVSSMDYTIDRALIIGRKKYKPALQLKILE